MITIKEVLRLFLTPPYYFACKNE